MNDDKALATRKTTLGSTLFKIISLPFFIIFNIVSFIFFGMSLNKFLDFNNTKKMAVINLKTCCYL